MQRTIDQLSSLIPTLSVRFQHHLRQVCQLAAGAVAGAILCSVALPFSAAHAEIANLEQTKIPGSSEKQRRTLKLINYLIDKSHYRSIDLNDEFSEVVLDAYLEQLDPARSFFIQEDIDQFSQIKFQIDDYIKRGTLNPMFTIFGIYRSRVEQRVEYALERMKEPFDFSKDETYELDREEAKWPKNRAELDDLWNRRIKNDILVLRLSDKGQEEITDTLTRRYTHLARRTRQFKSEDVFQTFVNAYVGSIEPHTSYFSPRASENFKINMRLSLEGIGAVLQTDNEYTLVRRVVPGGPADLDGTLAAEDKIVGVGQGDEKIVDVIGWRLDDVVELIRGPKESIVRLEIMPGSAGLEGETKVIDIVRDEIKLEEQAARKKTLEIETASTTSKIGLIELPSFYVDFEGMHSGDPNFKSTTRDVRNLLEEFNQEGIDGLVIDLRGNGGGALTEAIKLTGLFIRQGPVVQVQDSGGKVEVDRDPDPEIIYEGPLMVMVDRYSASASEIFAGAIQDYQRGLIAGEPTFGKGTVQNLVSLNRFARNDGDLGQLKVTIAQFFRVNGDSTQFRGVIPDVVWPTAEEESEVGERSFDNAIPWKHIKQANFTEFASDQDQRVMNVVRQEYNKRIAEDPEFQYYNRVSELNKERREMKTITLNETARRALRKKQDMERFELENAKRKSTGKKLFADIKALEDYEEEERKRDASERETDAYVFESARILSDYIHFAQLENLDVHSSIVKQTQIEQTQNN